MLLDFDGTLAPIAGRPEMASLPSETRKLLRLLSARARCDIGVVSGRALGDLKRLVDLEDVYYAGNHGLEVEGPNLKFIHPTAEKMSESVRKISKTLEESLMAVEGVLVEDKGLSASVHYRLAPEEKAAWVEQTVRDEVRRWPGLIVTLGKKVLEVKPTVDWNKGMAADLILKSVGRRSLPVFIGDDETDEDAFQHLRSGLTIVVMDEPRDSNAKYYLRNTSEVQHLLRKLADLT